MAGQPSLNSRLLFQGWLPVIASLSNDAKDLKQCSLGGSFVRSSASPALSLSPAKERQQEPSRESLSHSKCYPVFCLKR